MTFQSLFAALANIAQLRRNDVFLSTSQREWTFGALFDLSAQLANVLTETVAKPGDRLTVQIDKSAENIALYLATLRTGLVYTPLNTAYTSEELKYFLNDGTPSVVVCASSKEEKIHSLISQLGLSTALFTLDSNGNGSLLTRAKRASTTHIPVTRQSTDLAAILYTSGTTGRSKGAMLSQENLLSNALTLTTYWGFQKNDVLIHALPLFHIHGLFVALHIALLTGCRVNLLDKFSTEAVREALPEASVLMGVPTFYSRLLADEAFTHEECKNMRLFISGSAPLTAETHKAFEQRTGHAILERYGMSETGMNSSNPLDGDRIPGTVGFALPGISIRVSDDDGNLLSPGHIGNVEIRGANVFIGYWNMPEKTKSEFKPGGWFITGDLGQIDEEGRLTLIGRSKDLIISGGYNIYPKEIETILDAIDGITESAVIGVRHDDMGEGVIALLVPDNNDPAKPDVQSETIKAALEKLAKFKRPRLIKWVSELPRNAMGKVQKQILRDEFADAFSDT